MSNSGVHYEHSQPKIRAVKRSVEQQTDDSIADDLLADHDAGDLSAPNGHQWRVMLGAGKRKPKET